MTILKTRLKSKIGCTKLSLQKQLDYLAKELKTAIVVHDNTDFYKFKLHGHNWVQKGQPSMHVCIFEFRSIEDGKPKQFNQFQRVELKNCRIIHDLRDKEMM